ncbi:MAG: hypothetical protein NXI12_06350 [Alphaproteobacteria bacterium]|nr:hypothetical protein [Alphaproteobacteria bacterium]
MPRSLAALAASALLLALTGGASGQDDGPYAETTGQVEITPPQDGGPVIVNVTLPGPGYLAVEAADDDAPVSAEILDADGRTLGVNAARVSRIEGLTARLSAGPGGFPPAITLRFRPEMDYAEPNDSPALAWPVELEAITQAVLFPASDVDHFSFTLPEAASLQVAFGDEAAPDFAVLSAETGEPVQDLTELGAGDYVLRLSAPDATGFDPQLVEFVLVAAPPLSALQPAAGAGELALEPFRPAALPVGQNRVEARFEVEEAGIYTARLSNAAADVTLSIRPEGGRDAMIPPVRLTEGGYTLVIESTGARPDGPPVFATLLHEPAPLEPDAASEAGDDEAPPTDNGSPSVYVIGVEMTDEVRDSVASQVEAAGGRFVTAQEAAEVATAIQDIAREQDRGRKDPPWLIVIVLIIAAGGAGLYWMRRSS